MARKMLYSEFLSLTGMRACQDTLNEYSRANVAYMCCNLDKEVFCKVWHCYRNSEVVNGLIDEINRLQAQIALKSQSMKGLSEEINRLQAELEELKKQ